LHAKALTAGEALLLIREEVLDALRWNGLAPGTVRAMLRRTVEVIFETYRSSG
jgi:hypothetical protein